MRRSIVALIVVFGALAAGAGAIAHADEPPAATAPTTHGTGPGGTEDVPPVDPRLLVERHMREPEILHEKPSGFWTSNRPAVGGAYRYRLLLLGVAIAALMAALMIRVVRRHARRAS